jgi:para-nitrobenzyl esterase
MARQWLGIPYAEAERFGAPVLVPFDVSGRYERFGPSAPQPLDAALSEMVPGMRVGGTDEHGCLTLNIWAPARDDGGGDRAHRPVLVWFHGGSFVMGGAAQPVYDGARLADEQHVVVVTMNYRLGALGFLDARGAGGVANCGVRDALCALRWVQSYIGEFGGDPARVVMFGESAGGGLVLHTVASPECRGLVSGAIVQSGATSWTLDDERAATVGEVVCKEAGVPDVAALRDLPVDAVVDAQARATPALLQPIGMMPFHPMVDGDVLPARPVDALAGGTAAGVPMTVGTTSDEMRLFLTAAGAEPPSRERLARRIARYAGVDDGTAVVDHYARALATDDTGAIWSAVFSDVEMQLPARAVLDAHAPHGPAFAYLFTWEGPEAGACHGIDIPFPFGNFVDGWDAFAGLDDDGRALSATMRGAWAAFARDGDPGWPPYPAAMILGRDSHVAPAHPAFARLGRVFAQ